MAGSRVSSFSLRLFSSLIVEPSGKVIRATAAAAGAGAEAIAGTRGVITSFPGGIVASGSKVGCRNYRFPMPASTNHLLCPSLRGRIEGSLVPDGVGSIYEMVINGVDEKAVKNAMRKGIEAATGTGKVLFIGASNFEGKLGPHRFFLRGLFRP